MPKLIYPSNTADPTHNVPLAALQDVPDTLIVLGTEGSVNLAHHQPPPHSVQPEHLFAEPSG